MYFQDWFIIAPAVIVGIICLPFVLVLTTKSIIPETPDHSADEDDLSWGVPMDDFDYTYSMYIFDEMSPEPWEYSHFHSYSGYR